MTELFKSILPGHKTYLFGALAIGLGIWGLTGSMPEQDALQLVMTGLIACGLRAAHKEGK